MSDPQKQIPRPDPEGKRASAPLSAAGPANSSPANAGKSQSSAQPAPTDSSADNANKEVGGKTTIQDDVVAKTAGVAARKVPGVHDLGGGFSRALGNVREKMTEANPTQGVNVEVGETEAALDLKIVVCFGYPCRQVAEKVRQEVAQSVEQCTGLKAVEVNVEINDVHIPSADGESNQGESDRKKDEQGTDRRSALR